MERDTPAIASARCCFWAAAAALLIACGSVSEERETPDAGGGATDAGDADARTSDGGLTCVADTFEGSELAAHWVQLVGEPPTYQVTDSRLVITEAPIADTPSAPGTSHLYDLDTDKGNQFGWENPIGGGDFAITGEIWWSSSDPESSQVGIAVGDAGGTMTARVGMRDGTNSGGGHVDASIRVPGADADLDYDAGGAEPGEATIGIERTGGDLRILVDGEQVLSADAGALVSHVSIYYLALSAGGDPRPVGTVEIRSLEVCR